MHKRVSYLFFYLQDEELGYTPPPTGPDAAAETKKTTDEAVICSPSLAEIF